MVLFAVAFMMMSEPAQAGSVTEDQDFAVVQFTRQILQKVRCPDLSENGSCLSSFEILRRHLNLQDGSIKTNVDERISSLL